MSVTSELLVAALEGQRVTSELLGASGIQVNCCGVCPGGKGYTCELLAAGPGRQVGYKWVTRDEPWKPSELHASYYLWALEGV